MVVFVVLEVVNLRRYRLKKTNSTDVRRVRVDRLLLPYCQYPVGSSMGYYSFFLSSSPFIQ